MLAHQHTRGEGWLLGHDGLVTMRWQTYGPNPSLLSGSVLNEMAPKLLPWKLPSTLITLALPCSIPFFMYPHFLASLIAVSTASTPVFIGRTMSYPNIEVIFSA